MPQETDRLKLPLPLGNENVTRESINGIFEKIDAGVATQADLDMLREAVSKMDIPDASLTQKGKVQLSSKTDGTSETVAATEKAVRDARVAAETNAKNASLPIAGGVLTGVLTAPQIEMPNGTTIRTDSTRTTINAAANRFDVISTDGQKYLFSSRSGDFYMYDETGNLITTAKELKKSGVDAKNGIVGAINAKGGSASTSDSWSTLAAKVQALSSPVSVSLNVPSTNVSNLAVGETRYYDFQTFSPGVKYALFSTNARQGSDFYPTEYFAYADYQTSVIVRDKNNTMVILNWISNGFTIGIKSIYIDFVNRAMTYSGDGDNYRDVPLTMPNNFDLSGPVRLSFMFQRKASGEFQVAPRYRIGGRLIYA
ncbi:tail fiber protein [Paenibacillus xylanilyticus]|uniref:tail fiber protein n=1 Tax=Paenibacillus xylanilyticus TaxID=248903 RepID=UPI003AAEBB56